MVCQSPPPRRQLLPRDRCIRQEAARSRPGYTSNGLHDGGGPVEERRGCFHTYSAGRHWAVTCTCGYGRDSRVIFTPLRTCPAFSSSLPPTVSTSACVVSAPKSAGLSRTFFGSLPVAVPSPRSPRRHALPAFDLPRPRRGSGATPLRGRSPCRVL
jgi:hypothetical protein